MINRRAFLGLLWKVPALLTLSRCLPTLPTPPAFASPPAQTFKNQYAVPVMESGRIWTPRHVMQGWRPSPIPGHAEMVMVRTDVRADLGWRYQIVQTWNGLSIANLWDEYPTGMQLQKLAEIADQAFLRYMRLGKRGGVRWIVRQPGSTTRL